MEEDKIIKLADFILELVITYKYIVTFEPDYRDNITIIRLRTYGEPKWYEAECSIDNMVFDIPMIISGYPSIKEYEIIQALRNCIANIQHMVTKDIPTTGFEQLPKGYNDGYYGRK